MTLTKGAPAPDFLLPDQEGTMHSLSEYKGKWIVLYFYPKDDTPGCTAEACSFRDARTELQQKGLEVIGVSVDPVKSHATFAKKYELPFTLLSDEEKKTVADYGVWAEKSMYGKTYMGILRTTFLIDPAQRIASVYEKVTPEEHAGLILRDFDALQAA